jgi:hypothetical protein
MVKKVWGVMSNQFNAGLNDELIDELVELFPGIAYRDIKMLLATVLRIIGAGKGALDVETFRRCALFRAVKINQDKSFRSH